MKKDISFLKESFIAHRGYHNSALDIPENSMLAFKRAIEYNFTIELDLHILKDKKVVVFHDDNLKRMTGIDRNLKDMCFDEIKDIRLQKTDEKIPLFKDVLSLVNDKVPIVIELKYDVKCGILEKEVIKMLENYDGKYAVKSFRPTTVNYFRKNAPHIIRGQLVSDFKDEKMCLLKKCILKNMFYNCISKPNFISCDIRMLPNNKINELKTKYKKTILGWTARNIEDFNKAKKYCDNIIFENINLEELN